MGKTNYRRLYQSSSYKGYIVSPGLCLTLVGYLSGGSVAYGEFLQL
jgi:hypothetical protein